MENYPDHPSKNLFAVTQPIIFQVGRKVGIYLFFTNLLKDIKNKEKVPKD